MSIPVIHNSMQGIMCMSEIPSKGFITYYLFIKGRVLCQTFQKKEIYQELNDALTILLIFKQSL